MRDGSGKRLNEARLNATRKKRIAFTAEQRQRLAMNAP